MMSKIHVLPDENLGGVIREFVEVDRKAEVGDYVIKDDIIRKVTGRSDICEGVEFEPYLNEGEVDETIGWADGYYKTLEPTDVVVIDNQRYRIVNRKAKVGEKVIVVDAYINGESYKNGDIFVVREARHSVVFVTIGSGRHIALSHFEYNVLETVEPAQTAEPEPIEVDTRHASPQVIDMLANLAQRITELERKLDDFKTFISRIDFIENEIDTLHANQRKLAEETTNRLDRHSERIRELAEMIGERKPYFKTFHDEELVKRLAVVLYQVLRDNERDGESE
jgi:hypothetical protein